MGYFPGSLWNGEYTKNSLVQWFGEVASLNGIPPKTQMGDGIFPPSPSAAHMFTLCDVDAKAWVCWIRDQQNIAPPATAYYGINRKNRVSVTRATAGPETKSYRARRSRFGPRTKSRAAGTETSAQVGSNRMCFPLASVRCAQTKKNRARRPHAKKPLGVNPNGFSLLFVAWRLAAWRGRAQPCLRCRSL